MVFFNCNACGEALKKNQVEKHTFRCRQCHVVSCVDCGKDFRGNDYQSHTKCMTEDEKYCGKGYVPKVNKGEAKQEQWIENVQAAIAKSSSKPKLRNLLERLKDYPNIPRKKAKFENFLKNSLRESNPGLIAEVWQVLMEAAPIPNTNGTKQGTSDSVTETAETKAHKVPAVLSPPEASLDQQEAPKQEKTKKKKKEDKVESPEEPEVASTSEVTTDQQEAPEPRLSKRERKIERQKTNKEKKAKVESDTVETKKSKKRKYEEAVIEEVESAEPETTTKRKKKKKAEDPEENPALLENGAHAISCNGKKTSKKKKKAKRKDLEENPVENGDDSIPCNENRMPMKKKKKDKEFDLKATIKAILRQKEEISLKRLKKMVLAEFQAGTSTKYNKKLVEEKFDKLFDKRSNVNKLTLHKEKVMLNSVYFTKYR